MLSDSYYQYLREGIYLISVERADRIPANSEQREVLSAQHKLVSLSRAPTFAAESQLGWTEAAEATTQA